MKKKNNQNDSFDKRDDDEMEDVTEGENEKDFNPDVLDDALTEDEEGDDLDDEFEHDSLDAEKESEDEVFNNDEESPLWKL